GSARAHDQLQLARARLAHGRFGWARRKLPGIRGDGIARGSVRPCVSACEVRSARASVKYAGAPLIAYFAMSGINGESTSPRIMHRVSHDLLAVRGDRDREFYGLRVALLRLMRLLGKLPVVPAIKVLDDAHVRGFFFVVAHADLEGFVHPVLIGLDVKAGAFALADNVEGVAGVDADHFVFGRVVD